MPPNHITQNSPSLTLIVHNLRFDRLINAMRHERDKVG
jgi:hypothetical protein